MDLYQFSELVALASKLQHVLASEALFNQYSNTVRMAYHELTEKDKTVANNLCDPLLMEILSAK